MDMSPWALFLAAGPVGRTVMSVLLLASIWSWALIGEMTIALLRLSRAVRAARSRGEVAPVLQPIVEASWSTNVRPDEPREQGLRRREIATVQAARDTIGRAERGLADLAVVASTAPFVGLFGTVWGIMTSFSGLGTAHESSIAAVAPGIAEALAATAWGLAAAIPASVGYNRLGSAFSRLTGDMEAWIDLLLDHPAGEPTSVALTSADGKTLP